METIINIFIQARMSSSRFPGKVLAPLNGKPILKHIIENAKKVKSANKVVVLTSNEESDDPIVSYMEKLDCHYFRGSLNNVFYRFQSALQFFPCDYFVRLSGDSPLIDAQLIEYMINHLVSHNHDIVSNVIQRTYPKGQSVEMMKSDLFLQIDPNKLTAVEVEHVFPYFYSKPDKFTLASIENKENESHLNFCVDTLQDLTFLSESNV